MIKKTKQLYIVRKYIWASNASEAIKKDKLTPVQDARIDDEWKKNSNQPKDAIGFYAPNED